MSTTERAGLALPLLQRYSHDDLRVFSPEERQRLRVGDTADPQRDPSLAWELLYRLEPALYDRLVSAERLHPGIIDWLPDHVDRIIEVGAGSGRLTIDLVHRCNQLTAIEPAGPLRDLLRQKLERIDAAIVRVIDGFFDALPAGDRSAELVIACSALTPEAGHGGNDGLAEMERVCAASGMVVIVWPNQSEWLVEHGYRHLSFPGEMAMEFTTLEEAIALAEIFYPRAVDEIRHRGDRRVPYTVLGVNPPRDLAFKMIP